MARNLFAIPNSRSADAPQAVPIPGSAASPSPEVSGTSSRQAGAAPAPRPARCRVKGCIFPAASARTGRCLVHDRAEKEPKHFLSVQPSILLVDRAKFGIPDPDYEDLRARDRRRLAALRERFREEVA